MMMFVITQNLKNHLKTLKLLVHQLELYMKILRPEKPKKDISKLKYNFFVFDTETTKLEPMPKNFVFGVIYGFNYKKVIYSVEEFINEFNEPRYKNKYVFAHNAEFDLLTIFGNVITKIDNKAIFNGKFITAKYNNITFGDSLNIYPSSVEKIGLMLGSEKHENKKVKTEGLKFDNITNDDIEYCIQDCRIIYKALLSIFEDIGTIKLTIASLALYHFRCNYLKKDLQYNELNENFFESYYGGRTEAFL